MRQSARLQSTGARTATHSPATTTPAVPTKNASVVPQVIDPTGESTAFSGSTAPACAPLEGKWERYSFVWQLLFLMWVTATTAAHGGTQRGGGYPAGAVKGETVAWWREMGGNPSASHLGPPYMLRRRPLVQSVEGHRLDENGRADALHRYFPTVARRLVLPYLSTSAHAQAFERYLAAHPAPSTYG